MNKSKILRIQIALLVLGSIAWAWQAISLNEKGQFSASPIGPNVLHLKGSPFGRTLALAVRGPIDDYLHRGEGHNHGPGESCGPECGQSELLNTSSHAHDEECAHDHGDPVTVATSEDETLEYLASLLDEDPPEDNHEACDHEGHQHTAACGHDHGVAQQNETAKKEFKGPRQFLLSKIDSMRTAQNTRTNMRPESPRHRAHRMGEMERKLKTSYELDPSNLSGYGAYFLFRSEALARVEGTPDEHGIVVNRRRQAHELAHQTLEYCWKRPSEPTAMITGATAAHDCLQILYEHSQQNAELAQSYLRSFDTLLYQFEVLRDAMLQDGTWEKFPLARRAEMEQAHSLVRALHRADHEIWEKVSKKTKGSPGQPSS